MRLLEQRINFPKEKCNIFTRFLFALMCAMAMRSTKLCVRLQSGHSNGKMINPFICSTLKTVPIRAIVSRVRKRLKIKLKKAFDCDDTMLFAFCFLLVELFSRNWAPNILCFLYDFQAMLQSSTTFGRIYFRWLFSFNFVYIF